MLTVTAEAGACLARMLADSEAPPEAAVRFVVQDGQLALRLDEAAEGDQTIDHDGRTVLLIDPELSPLLAEKTLDVEESESGTMLALK